MKLIYLALALILRAGPARADAVNNEWNSTTENLSMGNVGIASSQDPASAMFYNPAALSRAKRSSVELFNPQLDLGTNVIGGIGNAKLADNLSLEKIRPTLKSYPGHTSSLGFSLYPNFYTRNFNAGVLLAARGAAYYDGGNTYYRSQYLVMPTAALTAAILGGRFRVGLAVRGISLTENDTSAGDAATGIGYRVNAATGFGLGVDAGALLALPMEGLPTIGLVARNVGQTKFPRAAPLSFATGSAGRPAPLPMTVDAGLAIFPRIGRSSLLTLSADYRDITNASGAAMMRHFNFGSELAVTHAVYLRAGMSRGYWTAGLGLKARLGTLDLGTYAEEMDATAYRRVEDRRVSLRYGSRF